jgi:CMP-N-acetylneuraminic acid synthetase
MVVEGNIAIIPARGGSKRLPRKNIMDFNGKPLIAWTIEAAIASKLFERIVVSTEDEEIAGIATAYGAEAPFLRNRAFDDVSFVSDAVVVAVEQSEVEYQKKFKNVFMLMPTCPLRGPRVIKQVHDFYMDRQAPSVLSCYQPQGKAWWAQTLSEDFVPSPLFPKLSTANSQDLKILYVPTGAVWAANRDVLMKSGSFYGPGHLFYPVDWKVAVDIDTIQDFEFARVTYELFGQV